MSILFWQHYPTGTSDQNEHKKSGFESGQDTAARIRSGIKIIGPSAAFSMYSGFLQREVQDFPVM